MERLESVRIMVYKLFGRVSKMLERVERSPGTYWISTRCTLGRHILARLFDGIRYVLLGNVPAVFVSHIGQPIAGWSNTSGIN